jgi:hypothetical protein
MKSKNANYALMILLCVSAAYSQVTGSGTSNTVPLWLGTTSLGDSGIYQTGGNVGIGTKEPDAKLGVVTNSTTAPAITGTAIAASGSAVGVTGQSESTSGIGVRGNATATSGDAYGVFGQTATTGFGAGVIGSAVATTGPAYGVFGSTSATSGNGVFGYASAPSGSTAGVVGFVESPTAVAGQFVAHSGSGLVLQGLSGSATTQVFSVDANGNLSITGNLSKGSGSFKIDHPLDPANKYLSHSFVESPDMMNIYNGVVVLNAKGEVSVNLPDYFQALNSDFRYQLTAIGAPGPNLYIAEEVSGNQFKIAGGKPGAKVSWQVTGVRQDAYAKAHRIKVEEDKPEQQKGHYLHPELFGATEKEAIGATNLPAMRTPVPPTDTNEAKVR